MRRDPTLFHRLLVCVVLYCGTLSPLISSSSDSPVFDPFSYLGPPSYCFDLDMGTPLLLHPPLIRKVTVCMIRKSVKRGFCKQVLNAVQDRISRVEREGIGKLVH